MDIDMLPFLIEDRRQRSWPTLGRLTRAVATLASGRRVVARAAPDCSSGVVANALTQLWRRSRLARLSTVSPALPCRTHRC